MGVINTNYLFDVDDLLTKQDFFKELKENKDAIIIEYNEALKSDDLIMSGTSRADGDWSVIWSLFPQKDGLDCRNLFPTITNAYDKITDDITVLGVYISVLAPDISADPHTDIQHLINGCKFKRYHLGLSIPKGSYLAVEGNDGWFKNYWKQGRWIDFVGLFTKHYPMNENKTESRVVLLVDCLLGSAEETNKCVGNYITASSTSQEQVVVDSSECKIKV